MQLTIIVVNRKDRGLVALNERCIERIAVAHRKATSGNNWVLSAFMAKTIL